MILARGPISFGSQNRSGRAAKVVQSSVQRDQFWHQSGAAQFWQILSAKIDLAQLHGHNFRGTDFGVTGFVTRSLLYLTHYHGHGSSMWVRSGQTNRSSSEK